MRPTLPTPTARRRLARHALLAASGERASAGCAPVRRAPSVARAVPLVAAAFACALAVGIPAAAHAQESNPRFGEWKLRSDAPPPRSNVMTYEPWMEDGMRITVTSTNADGESSSWGYTTLFDGVFRPVTGQQDAETAVEIVDARTTRILNRRNGRVYQVILNTLSEDGQRIDNEYIRVDEEGKPTRVSHATYDRIR